VAPVAGAGTTKVSLEVAALLLPAVATAEAVEATATKIVAVRASKLAATNPPLSSLRTPQTDAAALFGFAAAPTGNLFEGTPLANLGFASNIMFASNQDW